jgi:hypothetical protein
MILFACHLKALLSHPVLDFNPPSNGVDAIANDFHIKSERAGNSLTSVRNHSPKLTSQTKLQLGLLFTL